MFLSGCQFNLLSGGKVSGFGKERMDQNPIDRGAWQVAVHGITKSQTRLSTTHISHMIHFFWSMIYLENIQSTRYHGLHRYVLQ